jgi:hypothetical protein
LNPVRDLPDVVEIIAELLERLKLQFAFGGAVALNFWGTVRATQDVDVLAAVPRLRFQELATALGDSGFRMRDESGKDVPVTVERMVAQEGSTHLFAIFLDMLKVECFLPFLPIQHSILRRAVRMPLGTRVIPVTSAEDLILLKMAFHREKDLLDIRSIIWNQKGKLDLDYLSEWAGKMISDDAAKELEAWLRKYHG